MSAPYIVTISSEKGGVGKTTLATNLAIYLKGLVEDLPVTLFSFDNHFTVDQMFALNKKTGGSHVGHLFTDIVLDAIGGDVVIHNVVGGIRADLPQGDLSYGAVYEMFPFDNIVVQLDLSGAELREVLGRQVFRPNMRAGISGIRVFAACKDDKLDLTMMRPDGAEIEDGEILVVTTNDFLASGGDDIFTTVIPEHGFKFENDLPLTREAIADWLRQRGGNLSADSFSDADSPKWNIADPLPAACSP